MGAGRFRKAVALVLVLSVGVVFSAGCFGKFQLTRKVYEINQSVGDKYLRSAVTWVFVIVPVYGFAAILDFILFNLIEFWSGENPIVGGAQSRVFAAGENRAVMTLFREGGATTATIVRYRGDRLVSTLRVRDDGAGSVISQQIEGGLVVRSWSAVRSADGSVSVADASASGGKPTRYSLSAVETVKARVARIARDVRETVPAAAEAPRPVTARLAAPER